MSTPPETLHELTAIAFANMLVEGQVNYAARHLLKILSEGQDPNALDEQRRTALGLATDPASPIEGDGTCDDGERVAFKFAREGARVMDLDKPLVNLIRRAGESGQALSLLRGMLCGLMCREGLLGHPCRDEQGAGPLHFLAREGAMECFTLLSDRLVDHQWKYYENDLAATRSWAMAADAQGDTPLHVLARHMADRQHELNDVEHFIKRLNLISDGWGAGKFLVEHGANPMAANAQGETAIGLWVYLLNQGFATKIDTQPWRDQVLVEAERLSLEKTTPGSSKKSGPGPRL